MATSDHQQPAISDQSPVTIIGVDCATQAQKTGLAWGVWDGTAVTLHHTSLGQRQESIAQTIARWLPTEGRALLALDAPLGWPTGLGDALSAHQSGGPLPGSANALFRRETDTFIWQQTGKLPLDVGADRIARTAHTALALLQELRQLTGLTIPLVWEPGYTSGVGAIEVYPAGALRVLFGPDRTPGYKGDEGRNGRFAILHTLQTEWQLATNPAILQDNDDALDAALCVLCGADFMRGQAMPPTNRTTAEKEGWIWVRRR